MASFWGEIKRRKVFQAMVLYAVTAWLLVQVIVAVEGPLNLPDWADTFVIVLLAIGFPIVVILAWIFDFTPQGVRPTAKAEEQAGHHRASPATFTYIVQSLVLLAVGFLVLDQYFFADGPRATADTVSRAPSPEGSPRVMRFTVTLPEDVWYAVGEDFWHSAGISPDGQYLAFSGVEPETGVARLYVRPIDSVEATPLAGSEDGTSIFWSPGSDSIGFVAHGKLQVVSLAGGPPRELASATSVGGATWGSNDLVLASLRSPGPIDLIRPNGADPVAVTTLDPAAGERDHVWPQFLEDGDHFFYAAIGTTAVQNKVYVSSVSEESPKLLLEGVAAFVYAPPSNVLFLEGGGLFSQEFDADRLELVGRPTPIATDASSPLSASRTGAVTYVSVPAMRHAMTWIRRDGTEIGPALRPGYYVDPAISPDGTELAFASRESLDDAWSISILNFASGNVRRLTLNSSTDRAPIWSPDGESLVFLSLRSEGAGIYRKRASGVGDEELIFSSPGVAWPYWWSEPDTLHFFAGVFGNNDLWMLSPSRPEDRTALVSTGFNEVDGAISPDGAWYAYSQNASGRYEIYLTTFPPTSTKLLVTPQGGADAFWSPDGTELFYVKPSTSELMAVAVIPGNPPQFGAHRRVHPGPFFYPDNHPFFLAPDGERILVAPSSDPVGDITILLNWQGRVQEGAN
jgi:Tol biopolymer transport system component